MVVTAASSTVMRLWFATGLLLACLVLAARTHAQTPAASSLPEPPPCWLEAARYHQVNEWVLRAIIWQESRNNPLTVARNGNASLDVGAGGINSVHFAELARHGVAPAQLLDGCTNVYVSAWHLRRQMTALGNTWTAVGAYHSRTPHHNVRYAQRIRDILREWGVMP